MKPSVKTCDMIRCHKFWPFDHRCQVTGMVPGHMQHCPENRLHTLEEITEAVAELEHMQWVEWSKSIAATEKLYPERIARWKKLWVPYNKLTEEQKESDRKWAWKVIAILNRNKMVTMNDVPHD